MNEAKRVSLLWVVLAALFIVIFVFDISYGQDHGCQGGHNCNDGDTLVNIDALMDVDVDGAIIGGDSLRSLALVAPPLGDVDIAQCLGSTQWTFLFGGRQKLVLNQVCMAEFYLKQGRYDLAAQALCNQPEILAEYKTEAACEITHDFTPTKTEGEDKYDHDVHTRSDEFEAAYAQQEQEIEYLQEENASIVGRLDALTAQLEAPRPQPAPVIAQQQAPPAQKYSDEDMAYILGLYAEGESEDE